MTAEESTLQKTRKRNSGVHAFEDSLFPMSNLAREFTCILCVLASNNVCAVDGGRFIFLVPNISGGAVSNGLLL